MLLKTFKKSTKLGIWLLLFVGIIFSSDLAIANESNGNEVNGEINAIEAIADREENRVQEPQDEAVVEREEKVVEFSPTKDGWNYYKGSWYYANNKVLLKNTWAKLDGYWYFFQDDAKMLASGLKEIEGQTYLFHQDGHMQSGWHNLENQWYYFASSGEMLKNTWLSYRGSWYYFLEDGKMASNLEKLIDNVNYKFKDSGEMYVGWSLKDNKWYYFQSSGAMVKSSWKYIQGSWYLFDEEGAIYQSRFFKEEGSTYYLRSDGSMSKGWQKIDGNWYFFNGSGAMQTGWIKQGSVDWYYLYPQETDGKPLGSMASNTKIDGYVISPDGVYNSAYQHADRILNSWGRNLKSAFDYSSSRPYHVMSVDPSYGKYNFAMHTYTKGNGNCYALASSFYYMAKLLGYDVRQMTGKAKFATHNGIHSWCEVVIDGVTYICDPDFTLETGRNGYLVKYGQKGTLKYNSYSPMY